jgi:hypothetical protein
MWVCETPCETAEDCEKSCPDEFPVSIEQDNGFVCCPEGAVDVVDGNCVDADGNDLGVQYEPQPYCCGGTCCEGPDVVGCCGDECLREGEICCTEGDEPVIKKSTDEGCCTTPDGKVVAATAEGCAGLGSINFNVCWQVCPGKDSDGDKSVNCPTCCGGPLPDDPDFCNDPANKAAAKEKRAVNDVRPPEDYCVPAGAPCVVVQCFQDACWNCTILPNEQGVVEGVMTLEECQNSNCNPCDGGLFDIAPEQNALKLTQPANIIYICDN